MATQDISAGMEIRGLKESLKIVNKVDKKLRLEIGRDIKRIGEKTVVAAIMELVPPGAPMSGMEHRKRTGWYNSKNKGIKAGDEHSRSPSAQHCERRTI